MKLKLILFFCVFACYFVRSQKLSKYEKRWALAHPFAALKVKHISKKCFKIYNQPILKIQLDSNTNGGKLDAFRHLFFMAAFAQKVKTKKLEKLGTAHERTNYKQFLKNEFENGELPDSLGTVMDLKNNDFGFEIGKKHKSADLVKLSELVIDAIKNGEVVIIKRNKEGKYVDCNGKEIIFKKPLKWGNAKCLIRSNEE